MYFYPMSSQQPRSKPEQKTLLGWSVLNSIRVRDTFTTSAVTTATTSDDDTETFEEVTAFYNKLWAV